MVEGIVGRRWGVGSEGWEERDGEWGLGTKERDGVG